MSGMPVPKMGVVTMGGECFAAKVATNNPPMWCWTDKDGNRLVFSATEYILTGEMNTAEYERWSVKGADGKDGKDGKDGANGRDGKDGADGKDGQQGIQGCIIRDSEWVLGVEYHNDETLTSGTRYVDVALVRNDSAATGWNAYKCKLTHTSTADKAPGNATYWEEFPANMTALFTSLIIAKNAKIRFLQGNQLLIQKNNGTITAGVSGSEEGEKIRFWAGSEVPDNAPYRVTEAGKLISKSADIEGEVKLNSLHRKFATGAEDGVETDLTGYSGFKLNGDYIAPQVNGTYYTELVGMNLTPPTRALISGRIRFPDLADVVTYNDTIYSGVESIDYAHIGGYIKISLFGFRYESYGVCWGVQLEAGDCDITINSLNGAPT